MLNFILIQNNHVKNLKKMSTTNKNKIKIILTIISINLVASLLFIRLDPLCYQYAKNEFSSFLGFLQIAIEIPLFWLFGLIIAIITPPFNIILILVSLIAAKLNSYFHQEYLKKSLILTLYSLFVNIILIKVFFLLQSV